MVLNKKWGFGGLLLIIAGFFLHPDTCVSATSLLQKFLPTSFDEGATHIAMIIGTILLALAGSLGEKKDGSTN